jgi:FlaG/FlaF family flagellin (archaellin)
MPSDSPFSFLFSKTSRRRSGVSPVIATTILLGITVALGLGLWSFANAGVGTATADYAETVTEFGRFTSDKFVVPSVAYDHSSGTTNADHITIFVYNSGRFDTQIANAIISCKDCEPDYTFNVLTLTVAELNPNSNPEANESIDGLVPAKQLMHLDFDSGLSSDIFQDGYTYQIQVISDTGAYQTIYQKFVE